MMSNLVSDDDNIYFNQYFQIEEEMDETPASTKLQERKKK